MRPQLLDTATREPLNQLGRKWCAQLRVSSRARAAIVSLETNRPARCGIRAEPFEAFRGILCSWSHSLDSARGFGHAHLYRGVLMRFRARRRRRSRRRARASAREQGQAAAAADGDRLVRMLCTSVDMLQGRPSRYRSFRLTPVSVAFVPSSASNRKAPAGELARARIWPNAARMSVAWFSVRVMSPRGKS